MEVSDIIKSIDLYRRNNRNIDICTIANIAGFGVYDTMGDNPDFRAVAFTKDNNSRKSIIVNEKAVGKSGKNFCISYLVSDYLFNHDGNSDYENILCTDTLYDRHSYYLALALKSHDKDDLFNKYLIDLLEKKNMKKKER